MAKSWTFGSVAKSRPYVEALARVLREAHADLQAALAKPTRGKPFRERMQVQDEISSLRARYDEARDELVDFGLCLDADDGSLILFPFVLNGDDAYWVWSPGDTWPRNWRYETEGSGDYHRVDSSVVQYSLFPIR